jgi:mannose/fructose/N-acetylgalactosamine-specific phosphotransferase system component IIB
MNNNKICFISCVNDDVQYNECLKYINNLYIPEGLEVEIKAVKEAVSICHGYNEAMRSCDAKYKVYLHQDTFIINKDFISDILKIFNGSEKVGMLGVCGAKTIPTNAVWWDSTHKYGKVYENHTGNMELLAFNEVYIDYENVKAIDGLIMVTQYDLPWRDSIKE